MSVTSTVEENHRKDPSSPEKAAEKRKRKWVFWERKWRRLDYFKLTASLFVHSMALLAPFYFSWSALWVTFLFYTIGGLGITVSYHRNLAHRSFKVPKWLEYLLAYCALLAIQVHINNIDFTIFICLLFLVKVGLILDLKILTATINQYFYLLNLIFFN